MGLNFYVAGHKFRDNYLKALAASCGGSVYDSSRTSVGGVSVTWGFDQSSLSRISECRKKGTPFLFFDHAYFHRGYALNNCRVCFNSIYQNGVFFFPDDRKKKIGIQEQPWRKGREVIVIKPSPKVEEFLGERDWANRTLQEIRGYTGRPVRIKEKGAGLLGELKDCHAVVSLASVAEVEAAVFGVPVFTSEFSPASPVSEKDFSKIDDPIYPDREMWLRTLSYSQFNLEELADGTAINILRRLYQIG